ncbi:MAG TPA: TonB-dependent receptor, partial [Steroidobacteraceae bacterium]|nr:TonB-dependent receptor [Steroidobacteraceae bacterium]
MIFKNLRGLATLGYVSAAVLVSGSAIAQQAPAATPAAEGEEVDEVVVTGFRASLQSSVAAKRENIAFSDSIYAEDIGKFPDLNLAESLQRIPGVQIARDVTGEGASVAVRGLGRDFTQITLNGAPVETASDSNIDGVSQGRGVDLVLFPTELFRQLTVSKTPTANQLEGAIAANIDLRIARPFDNKGLHVNYTAKGNFQEAAGDWSPRLGLYASDTWDTGIGEFGVLAGVAYSDRKYRSDGFNTIGFTTVGLGTRCPTTQAGCNSQNQATGGYGNSSQQWASTVPVGYNFGTNGATVGGPVTVCGPGATPGGTSGLSCNDLSFAIWPRLARPDSLVGERETRSGILSAQWSPSESLSFFFDSLYSEADHNYERNDLNLAIRSTNTNIPIDVVLNDANVVTSATLANPQWLNENRPYQENTDFLNLNTGMEWKVGEKLTIGASVNYNHSNWFRSTNTYLFNSNLNSGITVGIESTGDGVIKVTPSRDLNDVTLWNWNALRIEPVQRELWQKGARVSAEYAFADAFKLGAGINRDTFHREITNWTVTSCATDGGAPTTECGAALLRDGQLNAKVAVPNAQLANFLQPWTHGALYNTSDFNVGTNNGWALPNYALLDDAVNIKYFQDVLGRGLGAGINVASYNPRVLDEDTDAMFVQANGQFEALGKLRYNVGVRRIETDQFVSGYVNVNTPTGVVRTLQTSAANYDKYLPSFNVASELGHGFLVRAAASRTMTRPQPGDIAPNEALSVTGDVFTRGNPDLAPYFSDNYDLGLEWYFGDSGLGLVAINGWTKKLEGFTSIVSNSVLFSTLGIDFATLPIATQTGLTTAGSGNPNNALVRVDQRQNTSELIKLNGIEVTYVQPLDFLLQGAGFSLNYTHISQSSSGGLPGAPSSAVTGLSPYTYNVTAFYENFGFSGRLSYALRDSYVAFLGNNENNIQGDNFAQRSGYLDASFSYKLPFEKSVSISLELQ